MNISKRQSELIGQIIQEKVRDVFAGKKTKDELIRLGDLQERLLESGPDALRVDLSIVDSELDDLVEELIETEVLNFVQKFHSDLIKKLTSFMNANSMSSVTINSSTLESDLDEFFQDDMMNDEFQTHNEIMSALKSYAKNVARRAIATAGGEGEDGSMMR